MTSSETSRSIAGLTLGVKLEQYARSILKQVRVIEGDTTGAVEFAVDEHIGIQPMLLALAMEFALKAWCTYDHNQAPPRDHDLRKLFDKLSPSSRERLDGEFRRRVAPYHPDFYEVEYSITVVLDQHADAFVRWRYMHELDKGGLSFKPSVFVPTLELVLDEYAKRYVTYKVSPWFP